MKAADRRADHGKPLSRREAQVLALLVEGLDGHQIGERLWLSVSTVKSHISRALAKLGATSRTHGVVLAARRGDIVIPGLRATCPHTGREQRRRAAS